jgi:hypothetical protein
MMKKLVLGIVCFLTVHCFGQQYYFSPKGDSNLEDKIIQSFTPIVKYPNAQALEIGRTAFLNTLHRAGFTQAHYRQLTQINDSTLVASMHLGTALSHLYIYSVHNSDAKTENFLPKSALTIPFSQSETFLNQLVQKLEKRGYSFAKVQLQSLERKGDTLYAALYINPGQARKVNAIVYNGYDQFPKSHQKEINRLFKNTTFNQENIEKLHKTLNQFRFIRSTKYPEILFTNDSTKIFTYIEKTKANTFDGYIGFTNNETGKLIFTGYIDGSLQNIMHKGEKITLYWKSNGQAQRTFNLLWEQPYIFKTPLALKAQLNIFKQDSTFQNTQTNFDLGYCIHYNLRTYIGYQATASSDIKNSNSTLISDYNNAFATGQLDWFVANDEDEPQLFPDKIGIQLKTGYGTRVTPQFSNVQFYGQLNTKQLLILNKKNHVFLKSQTYYLQSDRYLTNELFRFGGINSVRGFNENTLQASLMSALLSEYRYIVSPSLYLHSVLDYGYFKDPTINQSGKLLGMGFGFGLLTKNGLLNFVYANGSTDQQTIQLSNSIIQISLKTTF